MASSLAIPPAPLSAALSVKDYQTKSAQERSEYVVSFLEKMTHDIGQKNPSLAQDIKNYFVKVPSGKQYPEGLQKLSVELAALRSLADEGKVDLTRIQIEGVVVKIVKEKFPPPARATAN
jgi:hypothetical protein